MRLIFLIFITIFTQSTQICEELTTNFSTITCSNITSFQNLSSQPQSFTILKITTSNIPTLQPGDLSQFSTITELHLTINLQHINSEAFSGLPQLRKLHLNNNTLTNISTEVFSLLPNLEVLDLSNNNLTTIKLSHPTLTTLILRNNSITEINEHSFVNITKLKYLDVSHNPLVRISSKNLSLVVLEASSSLITEINSSFPESDFLDFTNNGLRQLDGSVVRSKVVRFDNNNIEVVHNSFKGVIQLSLAHNSLKSLDNIFVESQSLSVVDLSDNNISVVSNSVFLGLSSLEFLYLQNNNIEELHDGLFRDLTILTHLNVSHNNIWFIEDGTFGMLKILSVLDLSHNNIVVLDVSLFYSLSSLGVLRFNNNALSTFDVDGLILYLPSLGEITIDGNQWECQQLVAIDQELKRLKLRVERESYHGLNVDGIGCRVDSDHHGSGSVTDGVVEELETVVEMVSQSEDEDEKILPELRVVKSGVEQSGLMVLVVMGLQVVMCLLLVSGMCFFWKLKRNQQRLEKKLMWDYNRFE